jgi:hypothetical protein
VEASYFQLEYTVDLLTQDLSRQLEAASALCGSEKAQKEMLNEELARCYQRISALEQEVSKLQDGEGMKQSHVGKDLGRPSLLGSAVNSVENMHSALNSTVKQGSAQTFQGRQQLETQLIDAKQNLARAQQDKAR